MCMIFDGTSLGLFDDILRLLNLKDPIVFRSASSSITRVGEI